MELRKVKVSYQLEQETLFNEYVFLCELPPLNRKIIYLKASFEVTDIVENYDEGTAIVTIERR